MGTQVREYDHPANGEKALARPPAHSHRGGGLDSTTSVLETAARAPRHGEPDVVPEADAVKLLTTAWAIADGYILNC